MVDKKRGNRKAEVAQEEKVSSDREHLPRKLGMEFIIRFYRLLKGSTIYDRKNFIIDRLAQECLQIIDDILKSEKPSFLKIVRDNFFFNNIRIQMKADKYAILRGLSSGDEKTVDRRIRVRGRGRGEN